MEKPKALKHAADANFEKH